MEEQLTTELWFDFYKNSQKVSVKESSIDASNYFEHPLTFNDDTSLILTLTTVYLWEIQLPFHDKLFSSIQILLTITFFINRTDIFLVYYCATGIHGAASEALKEQDSRYLCSALDLYSVTGWYLVLGSNFCRLLTIFYVGDGTCAWLSPHPKDYGLCVNVQL